VIFKRTVGNNYLHGRKEISKYIGKYVSEWQGPMFPQRRYYHDSRKEFRTNVPFSRRTIVFVVLCDLKTVIFFSSWIALFKYFSLCSFTV